MEILILLSKLFLIGSLTYVCLLKGINFLEYELNANVIIQLGYTTFVMMFGVITLYIIA